LEIPSLAPIRFSASTHMVSTGTLFKLQLATARPCRPDTLKRPTYAAADGKRLRRAREDRLQAYTPTRGSFIA
jgi:hypothetical protein